MKCRHVTKDTQIVMKKEKKQQIMKCNQTQSTNLNAPKNNEWGGW
jgi:hypothetical protein